MAENTPDRRLLDAIAEALWSMDQTAPDDPSFHVYMEQVTREATVIAAALSGVVVLKTDLKQVGYFGAQHFELRQTMPAGLSPPFVPVFVLVEPTP